MHENEIAREIVDAAYKIHTTLGPGLLESVYENVLVYELSQRGLHVLQQHPIPVIYGEVRSAGTGFRADLIVEPEGHRRIEIRRRNRPIHKKQLLTYLRLSDLRLGLLINFNVDLIKHGITRIVNGLN